MLRLAYNTNGFPHHRVEDVAEILAGFGYAGISITPDTFQLNPFDGGLDAARELKPRLDDLGLAVAVETGARYALDVRRKHWPTLLDEPDDAERRIDHLKRCLEIAVTLGAETFSFWSGRAPAGLRDDALLERLCLGASAVLDAARGSGVQVCFEPEPGMAVQSIEQTGEFLIELRRPELAIMLDIGHVPVTEALEPQHVIRALGDQIGGLQLDDCADGLHEHLALGTGEIEWEPIVGALREIEFTGLAAVELPRHDFDPVTFAERSIRFVRELYGVET